jgi:hypothetical protein
MSEKQVIETRLRTAISNIRNSKEHLRQISPVTGGDDDLISAQHALDAAIWAIQKLATRNEVTLRESMKT